LYCYRVYGLNVQSEFELPELLADSFSGQPDVMISFGSIDTVHMMNWFAQVGEHFFIRIDDVASYRISNGRNIVIDPEHSDAAKIRVFLLGSAFGALLFQRGLIPLHGSAIAVNGSACIITGKSGAGKSTLTHAFTRAGYHMMTDDVATISTEKSLGGMPFLHSAYPQQKLWQQSLDLFDYSSDGFQTVWGAETKYRIPMGDRFYAGKLPFRALIRLRKTNKVTTPIIEPVRGSKKMQILLDETYRPIFAAELGVHERHFQMCTDILRHISVYELIRPETGIPPQNLVHLVVRTIGQQ
jgi:hypothetical protein